jgi:4-carboxymuconolactone decarboxylase
MRVPLVTKSEVSPAQQELYDTFVERVGKNYSVFKTMTPEGALVGPWSVWLQVPETGMAIDQLLEAIGAMPGLEPATIQSVILAVGSHFDAAFIMYAHGAVAADIGIPESHIAELCAGATPTDLDSQARVAVETARKLLSGGALPGPVYRHAVKELGQDGFDHLVYLVSQYCLVSMSLNAYSVPEEDDWAAFRAEQS